MEEIIQSFYEAFENLDAEKMVSHYHDDIRFTDPAFGTLRGDQAKNMWRMLCESQRGKDFRIAYSNIQSNGQGVTAHWEAWYTFSKTGRKVHNKIDATFRFKDGSIIEHMDRFNLHRWARQALGMSGTLIGWTPFFKTKLQSQTNKLLDRFIQNL